LSFVGVFCGGVLDAFSPEAGGLGGEESLVSDFESPVEPESELVESPDPSPDWVDVSPEEALVEIFERLSVL
jgi:hypothetical protein